MQVEASGSLIKAECWEWTHHQGFGRGGFAVLLQVIALPQSMGVLR